MNIIKDRAIRNLYPTVVTINGESEALDQNGSIVVIDADKVSVEFSKLQAEHIIHTDIQKLEAQETPRRLAESVLSDDGKAWLTANREKIVIERAKL